MRRIRNLIVAFGLAVTCSPAFAGPAALQTLVNYCGDYPEDMSKVGTKLETDGWTRTDPPIRDFDSAWYKSPEAGTQLIRIQEFKSSMSNDPSVKLFNCNVVEYDGKLDELASALGKHLKADLEKTSLDDRYYVPNYMVAHSLPHEPKRRLASADFTAAPFLLKGKTAGVEVKVTYVINSKFDR